MSFGDKDTMSGFSKEISFYLPVISACHVKETKRCHGIKIIGGATGYVNYHQENNIWDKELGLKFHIVGLAYCLGDTLYTL